MLNMTGSFRIRGLDSSSRPRLPLRLTQLPMTRLLLAAALVAAFSLSPLPTAADARFARLSEPGIGKPGWVRSSAWICDFSSQHHGMGRRIDIQADDICELLGEGGIIGELEVPPAVRAEAMGLPDRLDRRRRDASNLAIARSVQWVASCGGACWVRRTISATRSGGIGALLGGRDLSRSKPLTPSCMNRSCQRQTQVLDLPVSAMIDEFPSPSSLFRMIRARQTCFCELFGSATIACNR